MVRQFLRIFVLAILAAAPSGAARSNESTAPAVAVDTSAALVLVAGITQQPSPAAQQATPLPSASTVTTAAPGDVSPAVLRACKKINGKSLLRIQGDFGHFQGHVLQAGPHGLDGLRADPTEGSAAPLPGPVTWDRIDRIEKLGNSAGWWALKGGVVMGGIGLLIGSLGGAIGQDNPGDEALGAVVGASIGAGFGALLGASNPTWHLVYERPHGSNKGAASK